MSKSGTTISYAYNADGQRISKTVVNGGTTTETQYYYAGSQLTKLKRGDVALTFSYDSLGPRSVGYNGSNYYYLRNAQGDVLGIVNADGAVVVSYTYDAWGNLLSISGSMSASLGTLNPLRYRGYVYDYETKLYYLNSRYYNPSWGRFINADTPEVATLSPGSATWDKNLFAYCDNNPVMRKDDGGQCWQIIIGAAIGGVIGAVSAVASGGDWKDALIGGFCGAASGALAASGIGMVGQIVGGASLAMASNAGQQINKIASGKQDEFNYGSMLFDGVVGGVCGRLGGTGASYGNVAGINAAEKQFIKRGLTKAAKTYFVSQAHKQGGVYVYNALSKSLKILAAGSAFLAMKERVFSCNA